MNWINMLSPVQWLVMALVPPAIIMLYFLKLRRMPLEVPSTYLWRRTIEDLHVNSIWQRLRRNILLLLQLLAVLAIILACLRPGFRGEQEIGGRSIFLIDNSSSMQAEDVESSRLAEAKLQARKMIDSMQRGDVGMVIAFSDRADIRQGFTADKRQLREALASIEATQRTTDLNEALRAAAGLANPGRTSQIEDLSDIQVAEAVPANMYIFSDGGFDAPQLDLGNLTAEYIPIGSEQAKNVAILAFTVERNLENAGQVEAFARVHNFSDATVKTQASLYIDDKFVDASNIELEANSSSGVSFALANLEQGQMKLELDVKDDLSSDNTAYAGLDPPRQLDVVLVTAGNAALESALATAPAQALASIRIMDPDELESVEAQQLSNSGLIDLFIYDNCVPGEMPSANTLFLGAIPPDERWIAEKVQGPHYVIDVNRSHPMLQYVDMGTVRIVEGRALEMPPGGTELLRSDFGILFAVAPRGAYQDGVVSVPLLKRDADGVVPNTDWPRKRSFPVFVLNSLEYLGGAVSTAGARSVKPGEAITLSLANRYPKIAVLDPEGERTEIDRIGRPNVLFTHTDVPGFYQTRPADGGQLLQLFSVNLFSELESNIRPKAEVRIGAEDVQATKLSNKIVRIEFWRWLLAGALAILFLEWMVYSRRITV